MEVIQTVFGEGKELNALQMGSRAFVLFFITLLLIRIGGMRAFGIKSAFDNIIVIMLGAVMSRAVAGASPFVPTVVAGLVIVVVHRLLAWIGFYNAYVNHGIRGSFYNLYKNGAFDKTSLKKCSITEDEVMEELRTSLHETSLEKVHEINMERSGKLSIIKTPAHD